MLDSELVRTAAQLLKAAANLTPVPAAPLVKRAIGSVVKEARRDKANMVRAITKAALLRDMERMEIRLRLL